MDLAAGALTSTTREIKFGQSLSCHEEKLFRRIEMVDPEKAQMPTCSTCLRCLDAEQS
jgi:hypothetical protein